MRSKIIKFALRAVLVYALFKVVTEFVGCDDYDTVTNNASDTEYKIKNSAWDGSVPVCKTYLKNNLHDWDSYESLDWSPVAKDKDGYLTTLHKFRAKNQFGASTINYCYFRFTEEGKIFEATIE